MSLNNKFPKKKNYLPFSSVINNKQQQQQQ